MKPFNELYFDRYAVNREKGLDIFASRVEDEAEIDFVLWKLLKGISYVEPEGLYENVRQ